MYLDEKMEKRRRRSVQICSKLVEAHSSRFTFISADPDRCRKFLKVGAGWLSGSHDIHRRGINPALLWRDFVLAIRS